MILELNHNNTQTKARSVAQIETQIVNGSLLITSIFENKSHKPGNFAYKFKSIRLALTGTSSSCQSGNFEVKSGQRVQLSRTSLSIRPSDTYTLILEVYDGPRLIAKQTLSVPE